VYLWSIIIKTKKYSETGRDCLISLSRSISGKRAALAYSA